MMWWLAFICGAVSVITVEVAIVLLFWWIGPPDHDRQ